MLLEVINRPTHKEEIFSDRRDDLLFTVYHDGSMYATLFRNRVEIVVSGRSIHEYAVDGALPNETILHELAKSEKQVVEVGAGLGEPIVTLARMTSVKPIVIDRLPYKTLAALTNDAYPIVR